MTQYPLVSIIIPYYNSGKFISDAIESVLNQTYTNWEVILVNDGSTDPYSINVLANWNADSRIKILHTANSGPSSARNIAIKESTGDYILPLDSDNELEPKAIEILLFAIANGNYDAVYGDFIFFGGKQGVKKQEPLNLKIHCVYSQVDTCALISKKVFQKGVCYDEYLNRLGLEDWEFWINFSKHNYKAKHIPIPVFKMRVNIQSRTYQVANKNLDVIWKYVVSKHYDVWKQVCIDYYYDLKMTKETPDYKIGNLVMHPYRFLKQLFT